MVPALPIRDYTGRGNDLTRYMQPAVSDVAFRLGSTSRANQMLTGRLAKWGGWRRLLTAGERAALLAGEGWPFNTTPSLRDACVFYPLDEPTDSVTYRDATGRGNDLTRGVNTITKVSGPLGSDFAARFGSAGESTLVLNPPTPDVAYGNSVHSISGWCYLDALGTTQQAFWGQADADTGAGKFGNVLYYFADWGGGPARQDRLQSDFANNVDIYRNPVIVGDSLGSPGIATWHHMLFQWDPSTNTETLYIDGVANTLAEVIRPAARTGPNRTHFATPPKFLPPAFPHSGWDLVGDQCFASHAANADLSLTAGVSKSVWGWVRFDDFNTTQVVMGDLGAINAQQSLSFAIEQAAGQFYFVIGNQVATVNACSVALADTNWHAFVAWYNAGDATIHLDLDNGAATASVAAGLAPGGPLGQFMMGASRQTANPSGFNFQFQGDIGVAGISAGVPSGADITRLWAYGSGLYY